MPKLNLTVSELSILGCRSRGFWGSASRTAFRTARRCGCSERRLRSSIAAELAPQQPKTGTNSDNLSWNDDSRELAGGRGHVDCPWRTPLVHPASPPHLTS